MKHIPGRGNTGKSIKPNSVYSYPALAGGENAVSERVNSWVVTVKNVGLLMQ